MMRNPGMAAQLPHRCAVALEGSAEPAEEWKLPAAERIVRALPKSHRLLPRGGWRVRDRHVGKPALLALERGDHPRVAAIDVFPDVELSGFVDKGRLIGQMHRDQVLELDILFAGADHPREPLLRVAVM